MAKRTESEEMKVSGGDGIPARPNRNELRPRTRHLQAFLTGERTVARAPGFEPTFGQTGVSRPPRQPVVESRCGAVV